MRPCQTGFRFYVGCNVRGNEYLALPCLTQPEEFRTGRRRGNVHLVPTVAWRVGDRRPVRVRAQGQALFQNHTPAIRRPSYGKRPVRRSQARGHRRGNRNVAARGDDGVGGERRYTPRVIAG